jgi:hypothetical protein
VEQVWGLAPSIGQVFDQVYKYIKIKYQIDKSLGFISHLGFSIFVDLLLPPPLAWSHHQ